MYVIFKRISRVKIVCLIALFFVTPPPKKNDPIQMKTDAVYMLCFQFILSDAATVSWYYL